MRNSTAISIFKKSLLQFFRQSPNSLFNCHSPKGIKYELRLQIGLSYLREHKFKYSFQDTLNFAIVVVKQKQLLIFLFTVKTLHNKIRSIDTSILNQNNSNFTKTLVFGDPLNSATIDTLILLLQMLLLTLIQIPKDSMCLCFGIYRHGYF